MESSAKEVDEEVRNHWIELRSEKQWSRLLYPNPVCFLTTVAGDEGEGPDDDNCDDGSPARIRAAGEGSPDGALPHSSPSPLVGDSLRRNVMVLSWLTATNNRGGFVFSINVRRYSALLLASCPRFALSVPASDLQGLVLRVGSVTGAWGVSKLENGGDDHQDTPRGSPKVGPETTDADESPTRSDKGQSTASKRRRKPGPRYPGGIPGLRAVSLGSDAVLDPRGLDADGGPPRLFAVRGTVAHLQCRATRCLDGDATGDADHRLVMAHVERAWVREEYWDASRNVFAAPASVEAPASPYLTFLGSQTFGCVVAPPS